MYRDFPLYAYFDLYSSITQTAYASIYPKCNFAVHARQFDGRSLLLLAEKELRQANVELAAVQFVSCVEPLDAASPDAAATLWISDGERGLVEAARGMSRAKRKL